MNEFDVNEIRSKFIILNPKANFDSKFTFYYDETNNIRKFSIRESGLSSAIKHNFVLGGIVVEKELPNLENLLEGLNLQKSVKELKLAHLAKGNFENCLKSTKIKFFLEFLFDSDLYVHCSVVNIYYWSLVDIVDSAIVNSSLLENIEPGFIYHLKNDLIKLAKLEEDSVVQLFYKYGYPNIKTKSLQAFLKELFHLFEKYEKFEEFRLGLTSLKHLLKESLQKKALPFITNEEELILIKDFSHFYLQPIYTFKNSKHIFDKEDSIEPILNDYLLIDDGVEIRPYTFQDSQENLPIQISDVVVGLIGKFWTFINENSGTELKEAINKFNPHQRECLASLFQLLDKSNKRNIGFLHSVISLDDRKKYDVVEKLIK